MDRVVVPRMVINTVFFPFFFCNCFPHVHRATRHECSRLCVH